MAESTPDLGTDTQFRHFIDTVEEHAIFMLTASGTMATWNAGVGRLTGYSQSEFVGQKTHLIFTPEDIERGIPELEMKIASTSGHAENERWHVRRDGGKFWGMGVLTALHNAEGQLIGFAKIVRDRTDIKELQENLRNRAEALTQADRRKNLLLATVAHEIRNHLGAIFNSVKILSYLAGQSAELLEPIEIIDGQSRQVRRLVDDLLDITSINTGKLQLHKETIPLAKVVERATASVRPLIQSRQQNLALSTPPVPVTLHADPARLQQVFVNLLTNASKYTPIKGDITMNATLEEHEVVVRVRDNGIGISADMLPLIFDLFTQVEIARPHAQGGLGIGLALVRNLVEMHGGSIQVRSEGEGKGSEFTVRLPVADS